MDKCLMLRLLVFDLAEHRPATSMVMGPTILEHFHFRHVHDEPQPDDLVTRVDRHPNAIAITLEASLAI